MVIDLLSTHSYIVIYLGLVNIVSFTVFVADKLFATSNMWRVRERTLLITALAGGSAGALLAMQLFRHKTRKSSFQTLFVLILLAHVVVTILVIHNYQSRVPTTDFPLNIYE